MGKVVAVVPDKLMRDRYLWVQFADGAIDVGASCVCGSRDLGRLHRHWARCNACGRLLEISHPDADSGVGIPEAPASIESPEKTNGAPQPPTPAKGLDAFDDLTLIRLDISDDTESCFGVGRRPGNARILLSVKFPLEDGRRIPDPRVPGQWLYTLTKAPLGEFEPLLDLATLDEGTRVSWRIDEDAGPTPHEDFEGPAP